MHNTDFDYWRASVWVLVWGQRWRGGLEGDFISLEIMINWDAAVDHTVKNSMVLLLESLERAYTPFSRHFASRFVNMNECLSGCFQGVTEYALTGEKNCNMLCIPGKRKRGPGSKIVKIITGKRKIPCSTVEEAALNRPYVNSFYMIDVCKKGKLTISKVECKQLVCYVFFEYCWIHSLSAWAIHAELHQDKETHHAPLHPK